MTSPLTILLLEDDPCAEALTLNSLTNEGIECSLIRVETQAEYLGAIEKNGFDLILSDYPLRSSDGPSALKVANVKAPDPPFIFISGMMGVELAIETLQSGATDYVLKERMSRWVPAVRRAMPEAEERSHAEIGAYLLERVQLPALDVLTAVHVAHALALEYTPGGEAASQAALNSEYISGLNVALHLPCWRESAQELACQRSTA
jgi:CheY-like chemotaxis protein